jgi:hypothetical protein
MVKVIKIKETVTSLKPIRKIDEATRKLDNLLFARWELQGKVRKAKNGKERTVLLRQIDRLQKKIFQAFKEQDKLFNDWKKTIEKLPEEARFVWEDPK